MRYLLDTNICIYSIKRKPESVINKLRSIQSNQLLISSISVAELEFGVRNSSFPTKNQNALDTFLSPFVILDFDHAATKEFGLIRNHLKINGMLIGPFDMLIAAQAKCNNLTLVTNNLREFEKIPGLDLENWF